MSEQAHPGSIAHTVGLGRDLHKTPVLSELEETVSATELLFAELTDKLTPVLSLAEADKGAVPERVSVTAYDAQVLRLRRLNDSIREVIQRTHV